jgi:hypothetical protein
MKAELHGAFVWDCDNCGAENFVRAVEGNLDEEHMNEICGEPMSRFVAPEHDIDDETGECSAALLLSQVLLAPRHVSCKSCGNSFVADVIGDDEDGE